MPDFVRYDVNDLTTTGQLAWLPTIQGGADMAGPRAVIQFAARKGITRVPMGYILNGPAAHVLTNAIVTDALTDCATVILIGCDAGNAVQRISFAHVPGSDDMFFDWAKFTAGLHGGAYPNMYAIGENGYAGQNNLVEYLVDNNFVPSGNALMYKRGTLTEQRTFAIDAQGYIGEVDTALVERNTATRLDNARNRAGYYQDGHAQKAAGPNSMKVPRATPKHWWNRL